MFHQIPTISVFLRIFLHQYIKEKAEIYMIVGFVHHHTNGAGQPYGGADGTIVAILLGRVVIKEQRKERYSAAFLPSYILNGVKLRYVS
jgi:hypothetical protein